MNARREPVIISELPRCARGRTSPLVRCCCAMEGDEPQKLCKGFVVGTLAFWLGKRAEDNKSHEWTVHVRSANGDEDAGLWIKRVVFQLHPTLQPPTRGAPRPLPTPCSPLGPNERKCRDSDRQPTFRGD